MRLKIYLLPIFFGLVLVSSLLFAYFNLANKGEKSVSAKLPEIILPVIGADGELALSSSVSGQSGKSITSPRLGVVSANLAAIYDKEKFTGVRIIGELANFGGGFVSAVDPVVRFYNSKGEMVSQKLAKFSNGFDFKEVSPKDKTLYDVTVDSPPVSDRLELIFNVVSSSDSAKFLTLKIASRSMEIKTAEVQSQEASGSAQKVDYYSVSGKIVNTYSNLLSDITIYAWGRDLSGRVFSFGRADFKNDLLSPSDKIDFKIILLPIQSDKKLETYEIAAWGKEYHLLTSPSN